MFQDIQVVKNESNLFMGNYNVMFKKYRIYVHHFSHQKSNQYHRRQVTKSLRNLKWKLIIDNKICGSAFRYNNPNINSEDTRRIRVAVIFDSLHNGRKKSVDWLISIEENVLCRRECNLKKVEFFKLSLKRVKIIILNRHWNASGLNPS